MFDSDNSRAILTGGLIRSAAATRAARQDAADSSQRARDANTTALGLVALLERDTAELEQARARVARLELELLVEKAHTEGLGAQIRGFVAVHPNSSERNDSGKRYKDGDIKKVSRLRYETVFDAFLKQKGIADPTKHRAD